MLDPLMSLPGQPKIIAIVNQKGGVGKTTTAINLATAMAAVHKKILIVDFDPQGNASTGIGITQAQRKLTSYDVVMGDAPLSAAVIETSIPGLWIVPAGVDLAGAELELVDGDNREFRLRDALASVAVGSDSGMIFDYILIDCPPSLGLLTLNALVAAQAVIVPLQCEFFALEGMAHLVRTIERVRKSLNPGLVLHGIVLTMVDRRNSLSGAVESDVRGHFGGKVFNTVIPRNVRVSEAPSHGKPVLLYDFKSTGSQAYVHLAGEVLRRDRELVA